MSGLEVVDESKRTLDAGETSSRCSVLYTLIAVTLTASKLMHLPIPFYLR